MFADTPRVLCDAENIPSERSVSTVLCVRGLPVCVRTCVRAHEAVKEGFFGFQEQLCDLCTEVKNLTSAHLLLGSLSSSTGYEASCLCMCARLCADGTGERWDGRCVGEDLLE